LRSLSVCRGVPCVGGAGLGHAGFVRWQLRWRERL